MTEAKHDEAFIDYICEKIAELCCGYDNPCCYLTEVDDVCFETCTYCGAPGKCWKRYFEELYKEERKSS